MYFTPCQGYFFAGFAQGVKAVKSARQSNLPDSVIVTVNHAKKYAEGRAVRIDVKSAKVVHDVKKLIAIRMEH